MANATSKTGCSEAVLRELVNAGILAPSGDNRQPWRFEVDSSRSQITVAVDPTRDTSPMNAGQRMARIAVGAAAENIVRTAAANGIETSISSPNSDAVRITIDGPGDQPVSIPDELRQRCTNRRFYDGTAISSSVLESLKEISTYGGVEIRWIVDRTELQQMAQIIRRADTLLFSNHAMRNAFLENIRFDRPPNEAVDEGLSLGSLEATPAEAKALRLLTKLPNWTASLLRVGPGIGRKSQKLIESSSGLCIGFAPDRDAQTDFNVGRSMESAWLELTKHALAVQPMMSIPVLIHHSELTKFGQANAYSGIKAILQDNKKLYLAESPFLLRFGTSSLPSSRNGRR